MNPLSVCSSDRLEVGVVADKVVLLALLQLAAGASLVGDHPPDAEGVDVAVLAPPPPVGAGLALAVEGLARLEPNSIYIYSLISVLANKSCHKNLPCPK